MSVFRRRIMASKKKAQSEWVLVAESASITKTVDSDQTTFGPPIEWKNGKQYLFVFDIELIAITDSSIQIGIRDANTQSITFYGGAHKQVGDIQHISSIVESNRERRRSTLIGRLYSGNIFTVLITNLKVYEHI